MTSSSAANVSANLNMVTSHAETQKLSELKKRQMVHEDWTIL